MKNKIIFLFICFISISQTVAFAQEKKAQNPLIYADVPDLSMIRVGNTY